MEGKRSAEEDAHELALTASAKRPRREQDVLAVAQEAGSRALAGLAAGSVPRTSSLDSPTMLLTGHSDAVYSVKFAPNGAHLASASRDKTVSLWNVRGDCQVRACARVAAGQVLMPSLGKPVAELHGAARP